MPLTSEQAAKQVEERLREINRLVHEINNKRIAIELNIIKLQEKSNDDKSSTYQHKLKSMYKTGIQDAAQEENLIREALKKVRLI